MLWLQRPPLLRWLGAALLVAVAAWSELAPPPTVDLAYLRVDVAAGTVLTDNLVEHRSVPDPGFVTVEPVGVAATDLRAGEPLVASMVAPVAVPAGWVLLAAPLPRLAAPGDDATAVILGDEPVVFAAVVMDTAGDDPWADASGTVAVPPEWLAPAAAAIAAGDLVIGVETRPG